MENTMNAKNEATSVIQESTSNVEANQVTVLKSATAAKLNPNSEDGLEYEIGLLEKNLCIRVSKNLSGGFYSNEWILLDDIETCLGDLLTSKCDFKSATLKSVFTKGNSSNNAGFLCACLRAEGLLSPSSKNVFLHQVTGDFTKWRKALGKLKPK